MKWSFYQIWNKSLEKREKRKIEPRSRIWASELGGAMIDRYLKMTGVEPTNPPNPRSLRKFEAGNLWEWIVGYVLKRAGILIEAQEWVEFNYPNLLPVTGRLDYLAGGKPDWNKALKNVQELNLPDFIERATKNIVNKLAQKFTFGLDKIVLEIKSCSSFMFEKYERMGMANDNHILQTFHYLKAKNLPEAHIVYISKDDCRMIEVGVYNPSPVENNYKKDIELISQYISSKQKPPKEKEIEFNEITGKFSPNWKVMYSGYLTKLYGYKNQKEFEDKFRPLTARWNRVLQRMIEKKKMTKMNLEIIKEIKKTFPNFEKIVERIKNEKN